MTSSSRIAILDFVLGKILPDTQHLDYVSNDFMRFFLFRMSTKRVKWCEEDSLPLFIAFMSTRNQSVPKDRLNAERTASVKNKPLPIVRKSNIHHQLWVEW